MTPPRRYKELEELGPAEHEARQRAAREGRPAPKFETPEYAEARRELLERHGYGDDADGQGDPEDPAHHDHRKYGGDR